MSNLETQRPLGTLQHVQVSLLHAIAHRLNNVNDLELAVQDLPEQANRLRLAIHRLREVTEVMREVEGHLDEILKRAHTR